MGRLKTKTITLIKPQDRNPHRVSVFLDGSFWLGLEKELAIQLNLQEGRKLTSKEIENIAFQKEKKKALVRVYRLLSYRARSEKEIKDYLKKANFSQPVIEQVVADLKKMGYLSDQDFAEMWIKDRVKVKKYGPTRIKMELFQKGVDRNTVEQALKKYYSSDEESLALEVAQYKINNYAQLDFATAYRRLSSYLERRGFSSSTVRRVCQKVLQDPPHHQF